MAKETDNLSIHDIIFSFKLSSYMALVKEDEEEFMRAKKEDPNCEYTRMKIHMPHRLAKFVIVVFNRQASKKIFKEPWSCYSAIRQFFCNCNLCLDYSHFQINGQPVVI
jgi:7-cyano-7-deazaguanine synthase in queuosine biosynthesis